MSNRFWFETIRFYLLVALRGDPVERKPKAGPAKRAESAPVGKLKPLPEAK